MHLATGQCPGLATAVAAARGHWDGFVSSHHHLIPTLQAFISSNPEEFLQFLLDPTTQPRVLALAQATSSVVADQLCHLVRTWLNTLHRARFRALGDVEQPFVI